ncbi:MAG: hypothetical protein CO113_12105 [Elusimicrobia bacterium CG_4_9_14_3_um_filter_62_55]|nr:MAG: hypothetical protein COR54_18810 [Elusimicrobia bacterium CG22_combo_CG10-13_8_21_14_all_63_91]PJA13892.1 MAG: hypothetical protein COX66_14015 [Elusimicrobia bacterium CG_4_10_14_0_2_um_filter_63_34]PJB24782.1 MAG: hypothetical protein CO113_12105 [Elusimicrobia bacterium CG_4_9_14_3_um_filter_62_55]
MDMNRNARGDVDKRPLLLLVDDDEDFLTVMREILLPRYDVITLGDGGEFFETVFEVNPDLILLDVNMPGPDGFILCRRLKALKRLRSIPVLFITGNLRDEDFIENLDAGGNAFLTKPVDTGELIDHIESLLASRTFVPFEEASLQ